MPCAGYLEENLLLAFQQDFAVIEPAGSVHPPVDVDELLPRQAFVGLVSLVRLCNGAGFSLVPGRHTSEPAQALSELAAGIVNQRDEVIPTEIDGNAFGGTRSRASASRRRVPPRHPLYESLDGRRQRCRVRA